MLEFSTILTIKYSAPLQETVFEQKLYFNLLQLKSLGVMQLLVEELKVYSLPKQKDKQKLLKTVGVAYFS